MQFEDVIKGALLHDIGKFVMRAEKQPGKTHQETGARWLREHGVPSTIAEFALRHHRVSKEPARQQLDVFALPTNETLIVYEADNLSSGERPEKKGQGAWMTGVPLLSVFSKISLGHAPGKASYNHCWRYHKLGAAGDLSFPSDFAAARASYGPESYQQLLSAFEKDFNKIMPRLDTGALLVLLEKYTSSIPSETRVVEEKPESYPDISLFDHLKTTAAIAACLYRYMEYAWPNYRQDLLKDEILDRQDVRYLLVGGDFSGVQKFIYNISSKGALKTLRARSFFLELMTEHVIAKILAAVGLPRTNIIYSGGGRFYLLAPNTPGCVEALDRLSLEINDYLYRSYQGQLYLALEKVAFAGQAFITGDDAQRDIAYLWGVLRQLLNEKKNRKFVEQMTADPAAFWQTREPYRHICAVCHNETPAVVPLTRETEEQEALEVCPVCKQLYDLGNVLANARYIAVCAVVPHGLPHIKIGNTCYVVCTDNAELKSLDREVVYVLNSWSLEDYLADGVVQLFVGNYAARRGRQYKEFDVLAREAVGADRIGILRMDVDNLGTIFTRGFPDHERTFSRLSTLSRYLTQFFKYHINGICRGGDNINPFRLIPRQADRNITIVYAGGDDIFLAGAWDDVTEVAFDIAGCFAGFACNNPDVTISGGVVVQDAKYPLYKLAELAGEAEEAAKDNGRNSISLFYSPKPRFSQEGRPVFPGTLKWAEAGRLRARILQPVVGNMAELHDGGRRLQFKFSKGFFWRLMAVANIWLAEGKLYLPRLAYTLAREGERGEIKQNSAWPSLKQELYKLDSMAYLHTAVIWMDLLSRRGEQDG